MRLIKFAHQEDDTETVCGVLFEDHHSIAYRVESLSGQQLARIAGTDPVLFQRVVAMREYIAEHRGKPQPMMRQTDIDMSAIPADVWLPEEVRREIPPMSQAPLSSGERYAEQVARGEISSAELRSALAEEREGVTDAIAEMSDPDLEP